MRRLRTCLGVCLLLTGTAVAQQPAFEPVYGGTEAFPLAPRNALVIGVANAGADAGFLTLANPVNDATEVAKMLRDLRFSVIAPHENYPPDQMTRQNIKRALYDFALTLKSVGGVGLVYFSGHGIQRNGQMYLAPYGTFVRYDRDLDEEMVPERLFFDAFKYAGNNLNILIIDACRNNPWNNPLESFGNPVWAPGEPPEMPGVIQAHATLSGAKALDGNNLSPYATAFVRSLVVSDRHLGDFFNEGVATTLLGIVQDAQVPSVNLAGARDFVFHPTIVTFNREFETYDGAISTGNRALLQQLVTKYAGGYFSRAAKTALDNAPLAPVREAQAVNVRPAMTARIHDQDSIASSVLGVKRRDELLQVVPKVSSDGSKRASVPPSQRTDRAEVMRSELRPAPVSVTTIRMQFAQGPMAGVDVLTPDASRDLKTLADVAVRSGGDIEVVAYAPKSAGPNAFVDAVVLAREAVVLRSLKEAGFNAAQAALVVKQTDDPTLGGSIEVSHRRTGQP